MITLLTYQDREVEKLLQEINKLLEQSDPNAELQIDDLIIWAKSKNDYSIYARVLTELSIYFCNFKSDYHRSIAYCLEALEILEKKEEAHCFTRIYTTLATNHYHLGAIEKAQFYYQEAVKLNELLNTEKTTVFKEAKFNVVEKERETKLLKQKNQEIQDYARKLDAASNESKQFAHVASHDLKEPIRMINSFLGLLEKKLDDKINEEEKQLFSFAMNGAKRMEELINDLLTLSKIGSDDLTRDVELNSVLRIVKTNLKAQLSDGKTQLDVPDLPVVKGDKVLMIQLFQNLISNAIKYNIQECPRVLISFQLKGGKYEFRIEDNGIGIEPTYRDRIFGMFQRLHSREEFSGTGIGLTICKKIIDIVSGEIWVEDGELGGVCFLFTIPIR